MDRTLSAGIVSALQHRIQASDGQAIDNVIQTDQPIDAGSSGGPLLDAGGQVIGINSLITTPTGGRSRQALAFAVPIDTADEILARAAHAGPVRVAAIGLDGGPAEPVASLSDVLSLVTTRSPGQSMSLVLRRHRRLLTVTVLLGTRTVPAQ